MSLGIGAADINTSTGLTDEISGGSTIKNNSTAMVDYTGEDTCLVVAPVVEYDMDIPLEGDPVPTL